MKANLDRRAILIANAAASNGSTKPILTTVAIGEGKIVAGDGFILLEREILTTPKTGETILVKALDIRALNTSTAKSKVTVDTTKKTPGDFNARLSNEHKAINNVSLIEADYPKLEHLYRSKEKRGAYIAISRHRLLK